MNRVKEQMRFRQLQSKHETIKHWNPGTSDGGDQDEHWRGSAGNFFLRFHVHMSMIFNDYKENVIIVENRSVSKLPCS